MIQVRNKSKVTTESSYFNQELYQSAVGKLPCLSTQTRSDIAFAVSTAAKFTSKPTEQHWKAVKHILSLPNQKLLIVLVTEMQNGPETLMTESLPQVIRSRLGGATVSWMSRKQSCIALSNAEAEYTALFPATQEAVWLNRLVTELQSLKKPSRTVVIFEDN